MNMPIKAWLPDEALRGGTVETVLRDVASRWSEKWFTRHFLGPFDLPMLLVGDQLECEQDLDCRGHDDGLGLAISAKARLALAGLMLDKDVSAVSLTAADRFVLDGLAAGCLDDLCRELGDAFALGEDAGWRNSNSQELLSSHAYIYRLGSIAGEPLVHVIVEPSAAVALIKSRAPAAAKSAPLQSIAAALARQRVEVSARLGGCELSLADLAALVPGDVIVLDRDLSQPLEMALGGKTTSGRCMPEQNGDKLQLKIIKPLLG